MDVFDFKVVDENERMRICGLVGFYKVGIKRFVSSFGIYERWGFGDFNCFVW
jgi:hypothetical protein